MIKKILIAVTICLNTLPAHALNKGNPMVGRGTSYTRVCNRTNKSQAIASSTSYLKYAVPARDCIRFYTNQDTFRLFYSFRKSVNVQRGESYSLKYVDSGNLVVKHAVSTGYRPFYRNSDHFHNIRYVDDISTGKYRYRLCNNTSRSVNFKYDEANTQFTLPGNKCIDISSNYNYIKVFHNGYYGMNTTKITTNDNKWEFIWDGRDRQHILKTTKSAPLIELDYR